MSKRSDPLLTIPMTQEKIIIGTLSSCIAPSCKGWIVDCFCGKYWIRCQDPKHINRDNKNNNGEKWLGCRTQPQNHTVNGFTPIALTGDNTK